MRKELKQWADHIINGKTYVEAYLLVYPNATKKTAQNQVGTFRRDLGVMGYIEAGLKRISDKIEEKTTTAIANETITNILTVARKREILSRIASGEFETEKLVQVKNLETDKWEWKKLKVKPDFNDIIKAIDLDNKMAGDNVQAKPNQVAKAEEVTKVVVVEDETESPKK